MLTFIVMVAILSVVVAVVQFYAFMNWYKKPAQKQAQPAQKQATSARLEEGVALDGTL